jgi:hypothetical protein
VARTVLPPTKLLDGPEVAAKLVEAGLSDITATWVKGQADRGMIPFVVVRRRRRYREDLIQQIVEQWSRIAAG